MESSLLGATEEERMDAAYIHGLKKPCKNRGLALEVGEDGSVIIQGKKLDTISECEDYLESVSRAGWKEPVKEEKGMQKSQLTDIYTKEVAEFAIHQGEETLDENEFTADLMKEQKQKNMDYLIELGVF
jgi:hypothetical protein